MAEIPRPAIRRPRENLSQVYHLVVDVIPDQNFLKIFGENFMIFGLKNHHFWPKWTPHGGGLVFPQAKSIGFACGKIMYFLYSEAVSTLLMHSSFLVKKPSKVWQFWWLLACHKGAEICKILQNFRRRPATWLSEADFRHHRSGSGENRPIFGILRFLFRENVARGWNSLRACQNCDGARSGFLINCLCCGRKISKRGSAKISMWL